MPITVEIDRQEYECVRIELTDDVEHPWMITGNHQGRGTVLLARMGLRFFARLARSASFTQKSAAPIAL